MSCEEYEFYREELEEQKRQIPNGYQRIFLVVLNLVTVQLSPSAPNSIIAIALDFIWKGDSRKRVNVTPCKQVHKDRGRCRLIPAIIKG